VQGIPSGQQLFLVFFAKEAAKEGLFLRLFRSRSLWLHLLLSAPLLLFILASSRGVLGEVDEARSDGRGGTGIDVDNLGGLGRAIGFVLVKHLLVTLAVEIEGTHLLGAAEFVEIGLRAGDEVATTVVDVALGGQAALIEEVMPLADERPARTVRRFGHFVGSLVQHGLGMRVVGVVGATGGNGRGGGLRGGRCHP